jgi:hypothetical protein
MQKLYYIVKILRYLHLQGYISLSLYVINAAHGLMYIELFVEGMGGYLDSSSIEIKAVQKFFFNEVL